MWTNHARPVPGEPLLSPVLLTRAVRLKAEYRPGNLRLFSYARHALASYLQERGVSTGDLYVPSYICAEAIAPLKDIGQQVRYYPVQDNLAPDWTRLERQVDGRGRALLLVHYFGFPNDIETALKFSQQHGLMLIEDCAHSFLTIYGNRTIGTMGDAGIYSYRKQLPIPNGAGLTVNRQRSTSETSTEPVPRLGSTSYREVARQLVKYGLYRCGIPRKLWGRAVTRQPGQNGALHQDSSPLYPAMSALGSRIMTALEPSFPKIVATRRGHYQHLCDAFSQFPEAIIPFASLQEGVCPYLFPVLLADRNRVIGELQRHGIPALTWPDLPDEVQSDSTFGVAHRFASEIMTLPIHQDLKTAHIESMINAYREIRNTGGRRA